MADRNRILNYFFGKPPEPSIAPPPPRNAPYPTSAEALDAIKQGYGYGSGNEPYINAQTARVYDAPFRSSDISEDIAQPTSNVDLTKFKNLSELNVIGALNAQGALAANRNPISALGFDPDKIALQTKMLPTNVGGAYEPETDRGMVNVANSFATGTPPSTIVHESTHRGLQKLREETEYMTPAERAVAREARDIYKTFPPDEEYIVRHIMQSQMGDPERGRGDEADRLREKAVKYFLLDKEYYGEKQTKRLQRLQELAAEARKNRRPGGPR